MPYIRPVRNPLRTLPVRMYRGPIRNRLPGLGQVDTTTAAMNLPTLNPLLTPGSSQNIASQIMAESLNPNLPAATATGGLTDWLNTNASTMLWIAGVSIGVLIIARMGR